MSLQTLAQDMAARGRGPDTMLVHMAPKEVAGLQALAMAHGGSLTINPQTGLPEAGFLKNLLPTLIGAGLMYATGGTGAALIPGLSNAATIGLGVGGIQALRTGSLAKGLMAGLGAYGGAGLMGGIMGAGAGTGAGAVSKAAGAELAQAVPAAPVGAITPASPVTFAEPGVATSGANEFAQYMQPAAPAAPAVPSAPINVYPEPGVAGAGANEFTQYMQPAAPVTAGVSPTYPPIDWSGQAATINDEAAQRAVIQKLSTTPTTPPFSTFDKLKYGAAALAPALFQEPKSAQAPKDTEQYRYAYSPGPVMPPTRMGDVGEYTYFRPSYTRLAASGGIMDALPVQRMSDRNDAEMLALNRSQMFAEGGEVQNRYIYDSATRTYKPVVENVPLKALAFSPVEIGGVSGVDAQPSAWDTMSNQQKSDFYATHPTHAAITQAGQGLIGLTAAGMLQGMINPSFVAEQASIARGDLNNPTNPSSIAAINGSDAQSDAAAGPVGAGEGGGGIGAGEGLARGGISHLGDYSDGGRLLRGPGDGVSDSIPATIANKRPARLADGEFVVPARIVSELGNGSTDAGARKLYAMMDRIQKRRAKTVGEGKVAVNSRADKLLPA